MRTWQALSSSVQIFSGPHQIVGKGVPFIFYVVQDFAIMVHIQEGWEALFSFRFGTSLGNRKYFWRKESDFWRMGMFLGDGKCNVEEGNYFSTMENLPSKIFAASSPFSFSFSNHCFFYLNIYIGLRHITFCLGSSVSYSHIKSSARRIMNIED